jgi:DNA-binding response OmpR family regulator
VAYFSPSLLAWVWTVVNRDQPFHGAKNNVDVFVHNMRRKIDLAFGAETIDAASQTGYRLLS